jgi:TATA-binding protein-associated factor
MNELFPKLKYTKLTANVKANERFTVAQNFNGDNDIKVLLVTTSVGGEGLNLTSANTVIMFDHDYNPTVDMQAIDRAHRIGQKRVLNVYRLITKNTLEERIMGIQKFKKNLAEAIVNIDNSSIKNIEDSKLPELLENMKDLQDKDKKEKIKKSFYSKLLQEMENDAINEGEYDKLY